jgi:hypothetical protein
MNAVLVNTGRGASVALGLLLATASFGQAPTPAPLPPQAVLPAPRPILVEKPKTELKPTDNVHRMEILNGMSGISVSYFGKDLAPSEMAALRDLERAENDANAAGTMAALRNLYVRDEIRMEHQRHRVQMAMYGTATKSTFGSYLGGGAAPGGYAMGSFPIPNNYALVQNPMYGTAGIYPGQLAYSPLYPNVYTPGFWGDTGLTNTVTRSDGLQHGMGDEGAMKTEIARAMATQYTPESAAATARGVDFAIGRVASLPNLRKGLGMKEPGNVAEAGFGTITLTLKDGKELKGELIREDPDWLYVQTDNEDVSVRKTDVTKTVRPRKKQEKPEK